MKYNITMGDAKALAALAKLADKKSLRPTLQGIHLVVTNGKLSAYATDSYRLARYQLTKGDKGAEDGDVTVNAKALAAALKGAAFARLETTEDMTGRTLKVVVAGGATTELREVEGRYPDCERLLEHDKALPEVGNVNPAYLADVCNVIKSALGSGASARIETHAASAWHISAGDLEDGAYLDALIMPVRS